MSTRGHHGLLLTGEEAPPSGHRYWRLYIDQNDGGSYCGFTEVEFRGSVGGSNLLTAQTADGTVSASSWVNGSNAAWKGADGDYSSSGWLSSTNDKNQWWQYDFGGDDHSGSPSANVAQIAITGSWNAPSSSPRDFRLQWSDDGSTWNTVLTKTGEVGWSGSGDTRIFNI